MNGELLNLCRIIIYAKKALRGNCKLKFEPFDYENSVNFYFAPERSNGIGLKSNASSVEKWLKECGKRGLTDIELYTPTSVKERGLLGFSNTTQSCIICYFNKTVTLFIPDWNFNKEIRKWNINYTERIWDNPPAERSNFINNTESFLLVLSQIEDLANKIDCKEFAKIFKNAADMLKGDGDLKNNDFPYTLLPEENLRLFRAAEISDVFGAMGSWNDSPPYMASEKGLEKEYDLLSAELLKQMRLAVLFAVNSL